MPVINVSGNNKKQYKFLEQTSFCLLFYLVLIRYKKKKRGQSFTNSHSLAFTRTLRLNRHLQQYFIPKGINLKRCFNKFLFKISVKWYRFSRRKYTGWIAFRI